ncbi:MAG: phage major capsid protein, partial [Asticcacaulis sp.]
AADLDRAQARLSALTRPQAGPGCEVKGGAGGPGIGAYLRTGQAPVNAEDDGDRMGLWEHKAGLSVGTSPGAVSGVLVPPETARLIEQRLMTASPMREIATVRTVSSGTFRKPISTSGVVAGWVSETAPRPETDPASLALMEFPTAELYAAPAATQALLDDSLVNLDEWLASEVEDSFAAQETAAFVSGDGVNKPKGFLGYPTVADTSQQWGQIGFVASGAAGGFSPSSPADRLIDLIYATRAPFRANGRFVMNRRTAAVIRKFKDASGDYIWQPPSALGQSASLLGYPVTEIEQMPDIAANTLALAFGDFAKGYLIVDRAGVSVLRDPYTAKPYVLFYTTKRVGGGVQNFDAIKVMRFSA